MRAPVLRQIVRQHVEQAAFLWTVYDRHLLHPDENLDMDEERLERLIERLDAHIDGARVAGEMGREIARQAFSEFPEEGELFVVRMLSAENTIRIRDLEMGKVRAYLANEIGNKQGSRSGNLLG